MKAKLKPKTVKLLRWLQGAIRANPARLDMGPLLDTNSTSAPCGTAACIAGHIAIKTLAPGKTWKKAGDYLDDRYTSASLWEGAQHELQLTIQQARRLFHLSQHVSFNKTECWPQIFEEAYKKASEDKQWAIMGEIAIARIEHFIQTGGKE